MMFEIFDSNILNFRALIQTDIDDMIDLPSELARIGLLGQHSFHGRLSYFRLTHRQRDGHFVAVDRCSYIVEREFDTEIPDYELRGVKTFAELARVIERRIP